MIINEIELWLIYEKILTPEAIIFLRYMRYKKPPTPDKYLNYQEAIKDLEYHLREKYPDRKKEKMKVSNVQFVWECTESLTE